MADNLKDLPPIPDGTDPALKKALDRIREAVQVLRGNRGDPLDTAVTWRTALANGLAKIVGGGTSGGTGTIGGGGGTIVGGGTGGGDPTPDLTPPPTVSGLTVSAGLNHITVIFDAPTYTQGHGNQRTDIYAVQRDPASIAPLPTFGDAALVDSVAGASPIIAIPSNLNVEWHVWAKYVTSDGTPSAAPAGGTNGVVATTGKIGNADLGALIIQAGNLASGAVTGPKLAAASIAVGTAAIQNGAIVNAMIGSAEIDNAKIANVSAAKLTAGSIAVGEYMQSTGYVAGSSGWKISGSGSAEFSFAMIRDTLVAAQIGAGQVTASKISVTSLDAVSATIGTLRTASTGGRTEIKDNKWGVFDTSNVLRLRFGDLSGTF